MYKARLDVILHWFIIPVVLIFCGFLLILYHLLISKPGVFSLTDTFSSDIIDYPLNKEILQNEKVKGEFIARQNYLGIVSIRFNDYNRINNDILVFRLKEKNSNSWYFEAKHPVGQFSTLPLFPFGFPKIYDSEGKTYQFELESLKGQPGDAVSISSTTPVVTTLYEFPKDIVLSTNQSRFNYLKLKFFNTLNDRSFFYACLLYMLPLIFYFIWLIYFNGYINSQQNPKKYIFLTAIGRTLFKKRLIYVYLTLVGVAIDSFIISGVHNSITFLLVVLWIFDIYFYKLESKIVFLFALLFLFLNSVALQFYLGNAAQKLVNLTYLLLIIGLIESLYEGYHQFSQKNLHNFWHDLKNDFNFK